VGSESGASMVTSYLQNNGGGEKLIKNIQTLLPAFNVKHQHLCFIELYQNTVTFWYNARVGPK
jgi:hypothetical protein